MRASSLDHRSARRRDAVPTCPTCREPQIPWPNRPGFYCVHGHGLRGRPQSIQPEPLLGLGYRFGIDLSKLGATT